MHLSTLHCTSLFLLPAPNTEVYNSSGAVGDDQASGQNYLQVLLAHLVSAISVIDLNSGG